MAKLFAIVVMALGLPDIDPVATPYNGHVLCAQIGQQWGAYLISGTGAQLTAINALASVIGIVAVTETGDVKWTELDGIIASGVRTKINTWLTNHGYPTIPVGWTYRQTILAIFDRVDDRFDLNVIDIA